MGPQGLGFRPFTGSRHLHPGGKSRMFGVLWFMAYGHGLGFKILAQSIGGFHIERAGTVHRRQTHAHTHAQTPVLAGRTAPGVTRGAAGGEPRAATRRQYIHVPRRPRPRQQPRGRPPHRTHERCFSRRAGPWAPMHARRPAQPGLRRTSPAAAHTHKAETLTLLLV